MLKFLPRRLVCFLTLLVIVFSSCMSGNDNEAVSKLDSVDKMHYRQYMVYGQQLYNQHCSNCHQEDGSGLGLLIPPLSKSDYMLQDISRTLCLIRTGLEGEVIVNGESYNQKMPSNAKLTDLEIAQIATFIFNSWGNEEGYISSKMAEDFLNTCK